MQGASKERVPGQQVLIRRLYQLALGAILPTTIEPESHIERAKELLESGYGLAIAYTHFSMSEPIRLTKLWKHLAFAKRDYVIPIATHQYHKGAQLLSAHTGIEFCQLVTPETVARGKNNGHKVGFGSKDYLTKGGTALITGGIVPFAPSAHRTPELTLPPDFQPTDQLLNKAYRLRQIRQKHLRQRGETLDQTPKMQFGLLAIGVEIANVTDYSSTTGMNPLRRYIFRLGMPVTDKELLERLAEFRQANNLPNPKDDRPFDDTDLWLFKKIFPELVPPSYLPHS